MRTCKRLRIQSFCLVVLVFVISSPAWCGKTVRGGSDYGQNGVAPGPCGGGNTQTSGGVTAVCGYSGAFGSVDSTDTILQFELTNSSPLFTLDSATISFAPGTSLSDITEFGVVSCGTPNDPMPPLTVENPKVPCTLVTSPVSLTTQNLTLSPDGTVELDFSNFTGLQAGTGLHSGITLFFDDPNSNVSTVSVTGVTTSAIPEPKSFLLLCVGTVLIIGPIVSFRR